MPKRLTLSFMPNTCDESQRWVKSMRSKGHTPRQIWFACRKPEWLTYVAEQIDLYPWSLTSEEMERLRSLTSHETWSIYLESADFRSSHGAKVCCDIIRSKIPWKEVHEGLLRKGWT